MSLPDAVPTVSFHRKNDGSRVLGRAGGGAALELINGSQGLGAPPVSYSTSPRLAGHGSTLRGRHLGEREIFVPVFAHASTMSGLNAVRDDLLRFLSPLDESELTLRVQVPGRNRWREIPVHYQGGLQGDYGQDYHGHWQKLGLEFKATEALWRGQPETVSKQVDPGTKPFLSATENFFPVLLADSTIAGKLLLDVQGDAPTYPVFQVTPPGEDLLLGKGSAQFFIEGLITEQVNLDMSTGRLWSVSDPTGDVLWTRVPADQGSMFALTPGRNEVDFAYVGATEASVVHVTYAPRFLAGY